MDATQAFLDMRAVANKAQAENARLRKEMDGLYRTQASMQQDCEAQEAEIALLRQTMAEMQDDLDAAYRLLGLAPYPLTA